MIRVSQTRVLDSPDTLLNGPQPAIWGSSSLGLRSELDSARSWLRDCAEAGMFQDLEGSDVAELTDEQVIGGIGRWYEGGVRAFEVGNFVTLVR